MRHAFALVLLTASLAFAQTSRPAAPPAPKDYLSALRMIHELRAEIARLERENAELRARLGGPAGKVRQTEQARNFKPGLWEIEAVPGYTIERRVKSLEELLTICRNKRMGPQPAYYEDDGSPVYSIKRLGD